MDSEPNDSSDLNAGELLAHPVILQGAWMRVKSSLAHGDLAPQPELSLWEMHPERMLSDLSDSLRNDEWKPEPWLQVPYPKKGQRLRHYLMPTVRDQVAFMAHMVLLGPILDQQTSNFAFGNRWYRPIMWNRRWDPPRWTHQGYPVLNSSTYLPYARSHGLFRRVAHWTVARMTGIQMPAKGDASSQPQFEDYAPNSLPLWAGSQWWDSSNSASIAYWAALDIELAFPSVRIDQLDIALRRALALSRDTNVSGIYEGCPYPILDALEEQNIRIELGKRLIRALRRVSIVNPEIPRESWYTSSNHPIPDINTDPYEGLPTGLIISGLLLNVVLQQPDRIILRYLNETREDSPGAIVRFADDMYVLSQSREGLLELIEVVHGALAGSDEQDLARPNRVTNLCINFQKIKPDPVQNIVGKYLIENRWEPCSVCEQPLPRSVEDNITVPIVQWLRSYEFLPSFERDKCVDLQLNNLDRSAIRQSDIGPFVTSLVETMSDIGQDTLRQRFGEGAREYLARLHELTRFDIDDEQVRPDTRRMFSINRLVHAWLPRSPDIDEETSELRKLRSTISFALDTMPWKFTAWRAIVRAASRRPHSESAKSDSASEEANDWLANQLARIACPTDTGHYVNWQYAWPETDIADAHHSQANSAVWKEFYLSYLRAAFWNALADVILELRRHTKRLNEPQNDFKMPSPHLWTVRAVPEGSHDEVAETLSLLDKWICSLYPIGQGFSLKAWPWELDGFVKAVLAIHSTTELANVWRSTDSPGDTLRVPKTERLGNLPRTLELLRLSGRLQEEIGTRRNRRLQRSALAHLRLGHEHEELHDALFNSSGMRVLRNEVKAPEVLAVATNLRLFESVGLKTAQEVLPSFNELSSSLHKSIPMYQDYIRARRVIVGQQAESVHGTTAHRLLWGRPCGDSLSSWQTVPWETPSVGLPSRVVATLFTTVQKQSKAAKWEPAHGPLNWEIKDEKDVLATGRRSQFFEVKWTSNTEQEPVVSRTDDWEVEPNPAYFRPFLAIDARAIHPQSYLLYCDVLLMLTLLDGGERLLDSLATQGVRGTPFEDRWAWRSRIHLPLEAWREIEKILRWSDDPLTDVTNSGFHLVRSLCDWSANRISSSDFLPERIDVGLDPRASLDIVRSISPTGSLSKPGLTDELSIKPSNLCEQLLVRVGQTSSWPDKKELLGHFPRITSRTSNAMIEQVCNAFIAPTQVSNRERPDLIVLPESAIPQQEVTSLRNLVRKENVGAVAGLYWRTVTPPFRPSRTSSQSPTFLVNEAELILPIKDDRGPTSIRWFRVQKPVPAHIEDGLTKALTGYGKDKWSILRGRRWYRFVHPNWGDFSIAICADLIDSAPWRSLRSELLHVFMVAFNTDVELFDSLTWIRAYENFVNLVSVNHGQYGGSFVWSPKSSHHKELARIRGNDLVVTADVEIPVESLFEEQKSGVKKAIDNAASTWLNQKKQSSTFKSPPPGFRPRDPRDSKTKKTSK